MSTKPQEVSLVRLAEARYPSQAPFHPGEHYPEFSRRSRELSDEPNPVYAAVRELFRALRLDADRFGTVGWNPLGEIVGRGDHVVVKPNLICQENWARPGEWQEVITHPSVIRAIVDYTLLALDGSGKVTIADGPQTDSDFDALVERSGLGLVVEHYSRLDAPVELLDLRRERWATRGEVTISKTPLPGDPGGYVRVDLAAASAFSSYRLSGAFYGADYDMSETRRFHSGGRHEYILCGTPMKADVLINVPKLKTHKKTGVTLSLKNLVGINGYRNCLPHHTIGCPSEGGDEFPESGVKRRLESGSIQAFKRILSATGGTGGAWARWAKRAGRKVFGDTSEVIRSGNWSGNDTTWRMVMDLNQILLWYDGQGQRRERPRRYLSVIDGVIGGEGNGPLAPDPVRSGFLVCGLNPWAVDRVATEEMGLDVGAIPLLQRPVDSPSEFEWLAPRVLTSLSVAVSGERSASWRPFKPHFGWQEAAGGGERNRGYSERRA